jgi:transposase-like protein
LFQSTIPLPLPGAWSITVSSTAAATAHQFPGKALKTMRRWHPCSITTDKLGSYSKAIRRLTREGKLPSDMKAPHLEIPE